MKRTEAHTPRIDADFGVISVQPAFVEGIEQDHKRFADLASAYRHIFRKNMEWGVLLWSGVPVRISYRDDLPLLLETLIDLLRFVHRPGGRARAEFQFDTPNLETVWRVEHAGEQLEIQGCWQRVRGGYEAALNAFESVSMRREDFLSEWKLLLEQVLRAFADAAAQVTRAEARQQVQVLRDLEAEIPTRGRFYRYI